MKRLFNLLLVLLVFISGTIDVHAATVPEGNEMGVGTTGTYYNAGIMVKADFYKPSEHGITQDNFKSKDGLLLTRDFESVSERTVFERGTREPVLAPLSIQAGGADSNQLAQMYAYGDNSVNNISFLIEKNIFSTPNTGHKAITPRNLSQYDDNGYRASDGILSVNNLFMKDLLKVTANGTNWDATAISNELNTLWNYYVKPGGGGISNANVYRAQFASMFGGDGTTGNVQDSTAYVADVFNNQIQPNKSVGGFTITSVQQASNIKNLMMASMGLILGNPMGTLSSKGWTAGADYTYKGELILTNMKKWVEKGGNSDINDYHFSIKLEMYASHIANGVWYFDRWDMAFYNATVNSSKFDFAVLPGTTKQPTDIGRYSFGYDYNSGDSVRATTTMSQAMIDAHKRKNMTVKMNAKSSGAQNYYVSMMGIFQEVIISTTGTTIPTTSNWNFRNMLEFKVQALGNNTINLGYAFLNPSGANPGSNIVAAKPNFKLDATVKSPSNEVPKGEKGSATNDISLQFPGRLSDSVMTALGLKAPTAEWGAPGSEVQALLTLIDRASDPSQITGGGENSKLPVTITINRSIDTGGNEGKMIDELLSSQTVMGGCGHDLKIVSDNGSTAVLSFNIINNAGRCNHREYKFKSPRLVAQGKTGNDAYVTINNCVVATLMESASNKISFKDNNIPVTNTMNGKTTVTYTYSYNVKSPTFKIDEKAYGASTIDKMYNNPLYTAKGYRVLPENGAGAYPASDWTSGYYMSHNIQRKITFVRMPETPSYNNLGYDSKTPHYAEIKTGRPGNEPFEAMAGTPTTRDLYTSVSGTDFRVDFSTPQTVSQSPSTYRTYTYTLNLSKCWEVDAACSGSCPGPLYGPKGELTHPKHSPMSCGIDSCRSHPTNHFHPDSHTFTYTINIPIDMFNYFDMSNTEIWRLDEWGIKGGEDYLEEPNPSYEMGTEFWSYNEQNYTSMNGRLMFSKSQNGNSQGTKAPFGDNSGKTFGVSDNLRANLVQQGLALVNGAKNGEAEFKSTIISDYVVLQTSEGLQVPYFFEQESSTSVRPSSAPDFSGEGGTSTTSQKIQWPKLLTYDDFWFKNGKKLQCASRENGWHNASITYGGYNGEYKSLSTKYRNDTHDDFLSNTNPMSDAFKKYGITHTNQPNQVHDGQSGTYGKDASNVQHIKTGLGVPDEIPNGEYDTGKAWVRYEREMFVQNNSKLNPKSNTQGKFTMDSSGIYTDSNVPYYDEANKINDIVIHNPVSAEDAIVITNDSKYDLRTNADLMQGGDPVGLLDGNCPTFGCQFSTLECLTALTPHVESCYKDTVDISMHVGGDNAHDHTTDCFHKHVDSCYKTTGYRWYHDSGCSYQGETHISTSSTMCTQCGHGCGYLLSGVGGGGTPGVCTCSHCGNRSCPNYCGNHQYACDGGCGIAYPRVLICGKQENVCTNVLNKHVCKSCTFTYKKQLVCTDPHHYIPGEPTDETSPKYHYPLGDPRCWKRCGDDKKHGTPDNIELPNGDKASMGGTFINLDREFKIYFPFTGDFAESPAMNGIANTTDTRGKGYVNDMNVKEWTSHRWVKFPVNVIDPKGDFRFAMTQIDLNELSMDDTTFTFYAVLANNEMSAGEVKFTAQANNGPGLSDTYYDESNDVTNKERIDYKFKARHTAHKFQYIDVVGYIGALAINDTGDFRFANLFKKAKDDGSWLIPNLVPEVQFNRPNYIVADNITTRRDAMLKEKQWLDVYGNMKNPDGGKSGGTGNAKEPLKLPLVPRYNNIVALRNQPMRPGYQLYMDTETIGNYYGETMDMNSGLFVDTKMQSKMQIRPQYFSLDLTTSVYTPVDVYYGVNNEYMQVNDFNYGNVNEDNVGVQDYYYYLDWLNEAARRNFTNLENAATQSAKVYRDNWVYGSNTSVIRQPNSERDVIGSANVLFLNDLNRTFIGSSKTYEQDKNPGKLLSESQFNEQSQRWHFSIGLPSSAVFVESDKPCTEIAIKELQSNNRVIVATLDIKVQGDVWTLQYDGTSVNNDGFVIYEGGKKYDPPMIDKDGKPTTDPDKDVTSNNPIYVVYPSNKTSKDDVDNNGIQ